MICVIFFCAQTFAIMMMLIRGMLPKPILRFLQLITSGKFYQSGGIDLVIPAQPEFGYFYASRDFAEDNFREVFCVLASCWLVLYYDFFHLSPNHLWPFIHNILDLNTTGLTLHGNALCQITFPTVVLQARLNFRGHIETQSINIFNTASCHYLHCISETVAQVVPLIIVHYCLQHNVAELLPL